MIKLFLRRTLVLYIFTRQLIQHPDSDSVSGYFLYTAAQKTVNMQNTKPVK